jgi:hypothetical protein
MTHFIMFNRQHAHEAHDEIKTHSVGNLCNVKQWQLWVAEEVQECCSEFLYKLLPSCDECPELVAPKLSFSEQTDNVFFVFIVPREYRSGPAKGY